MSPKNKARHVLRQRSGESLLLDVCVIYEEPSNEPGDGVPTRGYLAHSLETDQIGHGASPLSAYVDLLRTLISLVGDAQTYPGKTELCREAPTKIRAMFAGAVKISDEFQQEAFDRALAPAAEEDEPALDEQGETLPRLDPCDTGSWYSIIEVPKVA